MSAEERHEFSHEDGFLHHCKCGWKGTGHDDHRANLGLENLTIAQVVAPLVDTYTRAHAEACPCGMPEAHLPGGKWNR